VLRRDRHLTGEKRALLDGLRLWSKDFYSYQLVILKPHLEIGISFWFFREEH
jgi:hypothetical protein